MDLNGFDLANLSRDELEEEYHYLQKKCKELSEASEVDAQKIHELKRNLETAIAAEKYLAQELEQQQNVNAQGNVEKKLEVEHNELQRKYHELNEEYATLQDNYNFIYTENTKLHTNLETLNAEKEKWSNNNNNSQNGNEKLVERLNVLEQENMELLQKIGEQYAEKTQQTMVLAEKEKTIEMMKDEISCLEENMRYKREELDEKTHLLDSAQEQLFEANSKINMLMSAPDNAARKGNSLFAEVDDQRKAMKNLLAAQKKNYQEMKKIYNESQYEIRRLKRENSAMHTELQACSLIFCKADRTYQESLTNRIKHLLNQNEDLEQKLKYMQQSLKSFADDKGVLWMDSMLNFCKQETDDLKKQVHSLLIRNATLEEQLRIVKQDMVRWRFEALKSRCLLINRENLLTENEIVFKPQNDVEYKITEEQEKTARPRILPQAMPNNVCEKDSHEEPENNLVSPNFAEAQSLSTQLSNTESSVILCEQDNKEIDKENNISTDSENHSSPTKSQGLSRLVLQEIGTPTPPINIEKNLSEEVEQNVGNENIPNSRLPSILCKKRETINLNAEKTVKFATTEDTVYNIPSTSDNAVTHNNINKAISKGRDLPDEKEKCVRTKSNVIVRRFVVGSKPK